MEVTDIAIRQADLLVRQYELRREPVMRSARSHVGGKIIAVSPSVSGTFAIRPTRFA